MTSFDGRVHLQASRATYIESLSKDSKKDHFKGLDVAVLQAHLDQLEHYWEKFEEQHEKLVGGKDPGILEHPYVTEKVFDACLVCYTSAKASLIGLIKRKDETADIMSSSFRRINPTNAHQPSPRELPKIPLPHFNGKSTHWRSFKDLFTSMVINNRDLSPSERLWHLRGSLSGEPWKLISNIAITDDGFATAWAILLQRYDNMKILITAQLEKLLNPPTIKNRTSQELNALITNVSQSKDALKALECPVEHWDQILVFTIAHKLDKKTREMWEYETGASTTYPKYADIEKFVIARARALENIEMHQGGHQHEPIDEENPEDKTTPASKVLVGNSTGTRYPERTTSWADMSRYPCSMCTDDHFVVSCPQFRRLTPTERKEVVMRKHLCYNCFGKHGVQECKITKRCVTCERKHHTMIHIEGEDPPAPLTQEQRRAAAIARSQAASQNSSQPQHNLNSAVHHAAI